MTTSQDGDTKTCFKCNRTLLISEFYRHPQMADGHLNKCIDCAKADAKEYRAAKIEYYRQYDRDRFHNDEQRRQYVITNALEQAHREPDRKRTRGITRHAVEKGLLKRLPCETCGNPKSEAHHLDYSDPFNVRWFCSVCHKAAHAQVAQPY